MTLKKMACCRVDLLFVVLCFQHKLGGTGVVVGAAEQFERRLKPQHKLTLHGKAIPY